MDHIFGQQHAAHEHEVPQDLANRVHTAEAIGPLEKQFVARLRAAQHAVVFTHQRPDPDALGSQAAMAIMLRLLGTPKVEVVQFDLPPKQYTFLQDDLAGATVSTFNEQFQKDATQIDLIVIVDTCTYNQLEPARAFLQAHRDRIIVVDHHLTRDDLSDLILADTKAAAACEIVWHLARHVAELPMDPVLALPLMSGLVADTGWFRFDSVRPTTHIMAADLTPYVAINGLYERLQQNETAPKLGLIQRALASIIYSPDQRAAIMSLSQDDFSQVHATAGQTEEIVNLPLMVGSVEVAALLCQTPDGRVRGSLRSKHYVDVNQLAQKFGGGGHAKAAGLRTEGPLPEAVKKVMTAIQESLAPHT